MQHCHVNIVAVLSLIYTLNRNTTQSTIENYLHGKMKIACYFRSRDLRGGEHPIGVCYDDGNMCIRADVCLCLDLC